MRLFQPLWDSSAFQRWYRRVRRVTRSLGPVRDSDVFLEELAQLAEGLGDGGKRAVAFSVGHRIGIRERQLEVLGAELSHLDLASGRHDFARLVGSLKHTAKYRLPLADFAHTAIAERAAVVFGALPSALVETNVAEQHALRIHFKRLRYAVEALAPAYGEDFDDVHATLTAFQDVLGELHDARIFIQQLQESPLLPLAPPSEAAPTLEVPRVVPREADGS